MRGSSALRNQVVPTPAGCTPTLASVWLKLGISANTPIEPVMVPASAMISSEAVEIQ